MARLLRLVGAGLVLELVLQLVVARAHVAVWTWLLSGAHLQSGSAAAAVVVPDLLMQAAAGYAVARAAGARTLLPDAAVLVGIVALVNLGAASLVTGPLQPHPWQVLTGLLVACVGTAGGVGLRLRTGGAELAGGGRGPAGYRPGPGGMTYRDGRSRAVEHRGRGPA
jgi:hypothetical protein